jgi:putative membrane protein
MSGRITCIFIFSQTIDTKSCFTAKYFTMTIAIEYLHFIGIMVLMGSLISEHLMLKPKMTTDQIKTLAITDLIYGLSAIIVLTTGLLRWFMFGKGSDYYLSNPFFHTKLTLFVLLGILSIFPTLKILKWRRQANSGQETDLNEKSAKRLLMFIRIELLIVVIIPLLAVMITRGVAN